MRECLRALWVGISISGILPTVALRRVPHRFRLQSSVLLMSKRSLSSKSEGKGENKEVPSPSPKKPKNDGVVIARDCIAPKDFGGVPVMKIISWNVAGLRGTLKNR